MHAGAADRSRQLPASKTVSLTKKKADICLFLIRSVLVLEETEETAVR